VALKVIGFGILIDEVQSKTCAMQAPNRKTYFTWLMPCIEALVKTIKTGSQSMVELPAELF